MIMVHTGCYGEVPGKRQQSSQKTAKYSVWLLSKDIAKGKNRS